MFNNIIKILCYSLLMMMMALAFVATICGDGDKGLLDLIK